MKINLAGVKTGWSLAKAGHKIQSVKNLVVILDKDGQQAGSIPAGSTKIGEER